MQGKAIILTVPERIAYQKDYRVNKRGEEGSYICFCMAKAIENAYF